MNWFGRWYWRHFAREVYIPSRYKLPEEVEEERLMSLEMHYGDEPLYLLDPPEWPSEDER